MDDVREQLVDDIVIKPYSSKYKIYIIDEAEKLTVQAQNAILKTIEEPPAYAVIIFLTNNAGVFRNIPLNIAHKGAPILPGEAVIRSSAFAKSNAEIADEAAK